MSGLERLSVRNCSCALLDPGQMVASLVTLAARAGAARLVIVEGNTVHVRGSVDAGLVGVRPEEALTLGDIFVGAQLVHYTGELMLRDNVLRASGTAMVVGFIDVCSRSSSSRTRRISSRRTRPPRWLDLPSCFDRGALAKSACVVLAYV